MGFGPAMGLCRAPLPAGDPVDWDTGHARMSLTDVPALDDGLLWAECASGSGASSLDVAIRIYTLTHERNE